MIRTDSQDIELKSTLSLWSIPAKAEIQVLFPQASLDAPPEFILSRPQAGMTDLRFA
jgi:hypothetical protein